MVFFVVCLDSIWCFCSRTLQVSVNSSFYRVDDILNFTISEIALGHRVPCITSTAGRGSGSFLLGLQLLVLFQQLHPLAWFDVVPSVAATGEDLIRSLDEPSRLCVANLNSWSPVVNPEYRVVAFASVSCRPAPLPLLDY